MALNEAIDYYHGLLGDELAQETQTQLDDQLRRRNLFFGERPLCTVLRPRFVTSDQYRFMQKRVAVLLRAFDRIYQAAMADASFRAQFGLDDWEERLVAHDPGFPEPSPLSRLDAFFVPERGGLRFTEYNAETPAAAAYGDVLAEVFLGLPVMRAFLRRHEVRPQPARQNVMHALIAAYRSWSGKRSSPRIAILDWREVPTFNEFLITRDYFRGQGIECEIGDPREAEYKGGRLYVNGFETDLVYKRVLISELVGRGGLDHPVVRAVLDGAVCMVNPFRCKLLHKKASLAVLSDERNAHLFGAEEASAIEDHIPWTRVVEERTTQFHGETVDLLPFIRDRRESLVLKPNDEYGGTGIVLGWNSDMDSWSDAIIRALAEPYIVQERVVLPTEIYPSLAGMHVEFSERILDTAPFIFHGEYMDGCLTRLSTESLVNVTAGGGSSVPTFVVERR
jgi:hypothetical protein